MEELIPQDGQVIVRAFTLGDSKALEVLEHTSDMIKHFLAESLEILC